MEGMMYVTRVLPTMAVWLLLAVCAPMDHLCAAAAQPSLSTDTADQRGISVTIYNVNLGLVKDLRDVALPSGTSRLRFMGVAS
jgi:hypothetical protein